MPEYQFERRTALVVAVCIVATVVFLLVRNSPIRDPNLAIALRIILSLACGVLGFSIPGFIELQYTVKGFSIRAFGAAALFVITFFGSPHIVPGIQQLPGAKIQIDGIQSVDLRSEYSAADHSESQVAKASALLTVPLSFRNVEEPAKKGIVDQTTAELSIGNKTIKYDWDQFVNMHEENYGKWLGIIESAHPLTVDSGSLVHEEVLHRPIQNVTWDEIVSLFLNANSNTGTVTVEAKTDNGTLESKCEFDLKHWSDEVKSFVQRENRIPGRITMNCTSVPNE